MTKIKIMVKLNRTTLEVVVCITSTNLALYSKTVQLIVENVTKATFRLSPVCFRAFSVKHLVFGVSRANLINTKFREH
jgi:hypothetical protein